MKCDKTFNIGAWYYLENNHKFYDYKEMTHELQNYINDELVQDDNTFISINIEEQKLNVKKPYQDQGDGHLVQLAQEDWICEYCNDSTYYVDLDYIGSNTNHLGCELEHEMSHDTVYDTEIDLDRDMPC